MCRCSCRCRAAALLMAPERAALGAHSRRAPEGMRLVPDHLVPNRTADDLRSGRDRQLDVAVSSFARNLTRVGATRPRSAPSASAPPR